MRLWPVEGGDSFKRGDQVVRRPHFSVVSQQQLRIGESNFFIKSLK